MFVCPECSNTLVRRENQYGIYKFCSSCEGRAVTLGVLRKTAARGPINRMWQKAREGDGVRLRDCPACDHKMIEVESRTNGEAHHLDVCTICHLIWFDRDELSLIPRIQDNEEERSLSPRARAALAIHDAQRIRDRDESGYDTPMGPVSEAWWMVVPAMFGLPVKYGHRLMERLPLLTWGTCILLGLIALITMGDLAYYAERFGLIPAELFRHGGLTLITCFFIHGGIVHLLSNLYFLILFGDDVEDYLGPHRLLVLLLAATMAGGLTHALFGPSSTTPLIGASGGISGVITFFAFKFPHAKLGVLFRIYLYFRWVRLPAWAGFVIWILLQFYGMYKQWAGFTNVSAAAHLGGALAGYGFWMCWKEK